MSFFKDVDDNFNKRNVLPIIGATIGVFSTLGAAGIALSPLLSATIAGHAAGIASALGLTTLGAGLIFGSLFAIVTAASIYQMFTNKAIEDAKLPVDPQVLEETVKQAIATKNLASKTELQAEIAKLATQEALTNAMKNCASQANFTKLEGRVNGHDAALDEKADKTALTGFASQDALTNTTKDLASKTELQTATANLATQDALTNATKDLASKDDLIMLTSTLDIGKVEDVKKQLGLNQG